MLQVAEDETLAHRKVAGNHNPADICTKHVHVKVIDMAMMSAGIQVRDGKAEESLEVRCLGTSTETDLLFQWRGQGGVRWADLSDSERD